MSTNDKTVDDIAEYVAKVREGSRPRHDWMEETDVDSPVVSVVIQLQGRPGSARYNVVADEGTDAEEFALNVSDDIYNLLRSRDDTRDMGAARDGKFRPE